MKKLILFSVILFSLVSCGYKSEYDSAGQVTSLPAIVEKSDWEILILALIQVESGGDTLAVGKANDVGALQITPIYVREVNRILGEERYGLESRLSLSASLEMFEIMQSHHNPNKDIDRAIKLHNPKAGDWYRERVYNEMNKIRDDAYESCL